MTELNTSCEACEDTKSQLSKVRLGEYLRRAGILPDGVDSMAVLGVSETVLSIENEL